MCCDISVTCVSQMLISLVTSEKDHDFKGALNPNFRPFSFD